MNSNIDHSVGVIGSGLAGLASACTLAARGYKVTVFEKNNWLGGKAAQLNLDGYRFDMGPTILTVPSVLKRIFNEAERKMKDYLELIPLDPQWRCFYEDGSVLDLRKRVEDMKATLDEFSHVPRAGGRYEKFIDYSKRLHDISEKYFFWRSVGGVSDTFEVGGTFQPSVLRDLLDMRMGSSVYKTVRKHIKDERVAQMLDHFTQYVGSSPEASPAVLCGIAHMQVSEGVWYPMKGTRAVPEALVKLGKELGVVYRTGQKVRHITTAEGRIRGLETESGESHTFDAVVSNCDSVRTYDELVDSKLNKPFHKWMYEPACSGVVLYLGLNKRYDHLEHHNFVFSEDPEEEFRAIYQDGQPAPDPTCYVAAPAKTEPAVAPEGGEAMYILVHTPHLRHHHDWKRMFPKYRQVILDKMKNCAGCEDIEDRIVCESALTPQDIHDRYHVLNGAIYGLASHGKFNGAFKPANRSPHVDGLYLAGGASHPGPGMPMVMMSGWIAADSLDEDVRGGDAVRAPFEEMEAVAV
ncbi:MAG: phytoene desaturase family protein [Verrucomicrobiota bacterium]